MVVPPLGIDEWHQGDCTEQEGKRDTEPERDLGGQRSGGRCGHEKGRATSDRSADDERNEPKHGAVEPGGGMLLIHHDAEHSVRAES